MFMNRTQLMTAMVVLVTISKSQLVMAGGHPGGSNGFHKFGNNQMQMSKPQFVSKGVPHVTNTIQHKPVFQQFQQPSGLKQVHKFSGNFNPVLGQPHVVKFPQTNLGNFGLGNGKPVKFPQSGLGNIGLGQGKPIGLPQTGNIKPINNPILNGGKFPGIIGNKPFNPGVIGGKFPFPNGPISGPITTKPFFPGKFGFGSGFCIGGCYPNWGCGWPNYGCYPNWGYGHCGWYPPLYGFNYPVVQSYPYGWPVSSPTYVSTTPQVIQVQPAATNVVVQEPQTTLPPAPPALMEIDLAITDVRLVDAGTMTTGPMYRVTLMNKGPNDMTTTTRLAVVSMKAEQTQQETPHQLETVRMLKVNESVEMTVRMPLAAKDFPMLTVAVEIPANFKDLNERDNVAQGEAAQIPTLAAMK